MRPAALCVLLLAVAPRALPAQSLAQRLAGVRDGTVRLSFAARPGICGNGHDIISDRDDRDWESDCDDGPVRVVIARRNGNTTAVRTYVGGRWRSAANATDWGVVPVRSAVDLLVSITRSTVADVDAVFPITLADSVQPWGQLLAIARDQSVRPGVRKKAVFWLGQAAGDAAARGLDSVLSDRNGDRSIQEQAVFALSQRPRGEGVPALVRVARTHSDPEIRKKAIFWLGQSDDPQAIALFEELLLK